MDNHNIKVLGTRFSTGILSRYILYSQISVNKKWYYKKLCNKEQIFNRNIYYSKNLKVPPATQQIQGYTAGAEHVMREI